jgi:hypothetical protein
MKTAVKCFPYLLVFTFFFAINLNGQSLPEAYSKNADTIPTATIEFEELTYDFGTVEEGTKVTHVFTFTNTSNEPLILSGVRGSCGCTVPQWPKAPVMPGETASITVEFNSKNKRGERRQKVTITANTEPAQTFIYLTGKIKERASSDDLEIDLATEEELSPDCFAVYPNPTAEVIKLEIEEKSLGQSAIISIFSKSGQLMARREIQSVDDVVEFSVSHYPAGSYIANVQLGDQKPQAHCFIVID